MRLTTSEVGQLGLLLAGHLAFPVMNTSWSAGSRATRIVSTPSHLQYQSSRQKSLTTLFVEKVAPFLGDSRCIPTPRAAAGDAAFAEDAGASASASPAPSIAA